MLNSSQAKKRIISIVLAGAMVLGFISAITLLNTRPVHAQAASQALAESTAGQAEAGCQTTGPNPSWCPFKGLRESLATVGDKIVAPKFRIVMLQALLNVTQFALDRIAYEAAVAVAAGGAGQGSLFHAQSASEAWKQFGLRAAGEYLGQLNEVTDGYLGVGFDLCSPGDLLNLALAIGIKQRYQPEEPSCDILAVGKNWKKYINSTYQTITDSDKRDAAIMGKFAESLKPGRNELSATLRINAAIDQKIHQEKITKFFEQNESEGFKDIKGYITGNVETPSSILNKEFEKKVLDKDGNVQEMTFGMAVQNSDLLGALFSTTAATFTNTLLSELFNQIYMGLFKVDVPNIDLGNFETAEAQGGRAAAEERFSGLLASNPIGTTNFDALAEFVVCIAEGITNRGLNNCVMDVNFLAAVSRGNSGVPMTVQEAIDEGLLNGNFPVISPQDKPSNQDPYCYTYGYCYGNIVKLRKARVLPIGWELAALRNDTTNPATLQEVIDGFNNCTDDGAIGSAYADDDDARWCHLIDPNWVLKYPETQCRATVNGEIRVGALANGRLNTCADSPSCIGEDNEGLCSEGFGYCVREKNVWRFRGKECPSEYASCLAFENTFTGASAGYLVNTVDYSVCDGDNAGCQWYRTNKYYSDADTDDDTTDDSYEWLPSGSDYVTAERDDAWLYQNVDEETVARVAFDDYVSFADYDAASVAEVYSFEDRVYFTHDVVTCDEDEAGCTQLFEIEDETVLNTLVNASFETDEDGNGAPDGWISSDVALTTIESTGLSVYGDSAVVLEPNSNIQQRIQAPAGNFYTFSTYALGETSGDHALIRLVFYDEDGEVVSAEGTSSAGDCEYNSTRDWYQINEAADTEDWARYECVFTTPEDTEQVRLIMMNPTRSTSDIHYDAVQLELGEDANAFVSGYLIEPVANYYKVAPDYLGCTGAATDPDDCDNYAQMCTAQDVGCSLYAPEDGDPNVPAIISSLDECPSECVGYTTYKQEATDYDDEDFPLYFIASSARTCTEQFVGCDAFTNLSSVEEGGEVVEHYTELRSCLTDDMATGDDNTTSATFFTWEGSDNEGYQLMTWYLLESDLSRSSFTFDDSGITETDPEFAPCANWLVDAEDSVVCVDSEIDSDTGARYYAENVKGNDECDEHDDIFENPDCREFFDTEGNIHYRQYSDTISISDACVPYRKDESSEDDCDASGGFWTDQGFCRYFGLQEESSECSVEQSGCRLYTGGTGRNATTILNDTFEGGTYDSYEVADFGGTLAISNESVATEGHSLRITADDEYLGFSTVHAYLNGEDDDDAFDVEDTAATCTDFSDRYLNDTETACLVDLDGDGAGDDECAIYDGEVSCGTLVDFLSEDKTFVLDFWAKGSTSLSVGLLDHAGFDGDIHDLVDVDNEPSIITSLETISLTGAWELYSLGPLDVSDFEDFDENAILAFLIGTSGEDTEVFIDNITLKQVEENITLIKDSWVTPSTCDETPVGTESDQYYLGCEAYTDQNQEEFNIYQFSDLCSEEVVGCGDFYDTQNSESVYQQIFNARCAYDTDGDLSGVETVSSNTDCVVDDVTYCTITAGQSYCTFDVDGVLEDPLPLDTTAGFGIIYGPETVVVPGDQPVYIVATSDSECTSAGMGCQEVGLPTFTQDQSEVESFDSTYVINLPDSYDTILCADQELFCEEWESTQDGNWYFKDPHDKNCEYKTNITIDGQQYFGWFREDTTDPCYFDDDDDDGSWDVDSEDAYLIAGEEFGTWRNGDEDYDGWVAGCSTQHDLCTEFIDTVDTGGGLNESGQSYYFINDELLDEDTLTASQRCNGQVSQKAGCPSLNNTTNSDLSYNASASYVISTHADVFVGGSANDLVDPVNCEVDEGGLFEITSSDAAIADIDDEDFGDADGVYEVNVCERRCRYVLDDEDDSITTDLATELLVASRYLERSCFVDSDCPVLESAYGEETEGECVNVAAISTLIDYSLSNDSNEILKVNRDRSCAAWLACDSARTSWNSQTSRYESICDSINLCTAGGSRGDQSTCTEWGESDAVVLTEGLYSERDVNWTGYEYSGFSIPNQLPPEHYNQFNINPERACYSVAGAEFETTTAGNLVACEEPSDCDDAAVTCTSDSSCLSGACNTSTSTCYNMCTSDDVERDYRLVYNAGSCDSADSTGVGAGGECVVGFCQSAPDNACASDDECSDDDCVIGYCQVTGATSCSDNVDCQAATAGGGLISTPYCDTVQSLCVDTLLTDTSGLEACDAAPTGSCTSVSATCVTAATTADGSCYNNRCLTDIIDADGDGLADAIDRDQVREESCRGYPEIDSPFTTAVVDQWQTVTADDDSDTDGFPDGVTTDRGEDTGSLEVSSTPYTFVPGYQDAIVCAPDGDGEISDDCLCSYDKVTYGVGTSYRYYEVASVAGSPDLDGVCSGGIFDGVECADDNDCAISLESVSAGSCVPNKRTDSLYGWEGYCIERDSSIQLNASADPDDQACLTWLPIDQTAGATDLYGKYTEAGFPIQNTYYCAETAFYADLYPTGTHFDSDGAASSGSRPAVDWACALGEDTSSTGACPAGDYCGCFNYAYCPDGWSALVGKVQTAYASSEDGSSGWCTFDSSASGRHDEEKFFLEASGAMDISLAGCPYVCVPDNSYHLNGEDTGESCDDDISDQWSGSDGTTEWGGTYYKIGQFDDWNDGDAGDASIQTKFGDCAVRGVPITEESDYDLDWNSGFDGYTSDGFGYKIKNRSFWTSSWGLSHRAIDGAFGRCSADGSLCETIGASCSADDTTKIFESCANYWVSLGDTISDARAKCVRFIGTGTCQEFEDGRDTPDSRGSMQVYAGCYELVQATTSDLDDPNKAWTNRLLESGYSTEDPTGDFSDSAGDFAFSYDDEPNPAARALFEEYYTETDDVWVVDEWQGIDSWPLPVASCDTNPGYEGSGGSELEFGGITGLSILPYGSESSCPSAAQHSYPGANQYKQVDGSGSTFLSAGETFALAFSLEDLDESDELTQLLYGDDFEDG
ncbi:hypothetical protein HOI18_00960, partial [Candidatus Uhrbacteria bacterium]|nr:hypothetical protein [Candidatus Uhrbacteria bacterium]